MRGRNPSVSHTQLTDLKRLRCHRSIDWPMRLRGGPIMGMIITLAALFLPGPLHTSMLSAARGGVPPSIGLPHWHLVRGGSPITEPYPALHGGSFSGPQVKLSPDPLVGVPLASPWCRQRLTDLCTAPRGGPNTNANIFLQPAIRDRSPVQHHCKRYRCHSGGLWNGKRSMDRV